MALITYIISPPIRWVTESSTTSSMIPEKSPDVFIRLEPFHAAKYVVLYHAKGKTRNLPRKVNTLAFDFDDFQFPILRNPFISS